MSCPITSIWGVHNDKFDLATDLAHTCETLQNLGSLLLEKQDEETLRAMAYPLMCMADRIGRVHDHIDEIVLKEAERIESAKENATSAAP